MAVAGISSTPEAADYDILIPGDYFCDLIFTGVPQFPALGREVYTRDLHVVPGGVVNTVVALQRLGVRVGWVGNLGSDMFSGYVRAWVEREGVDTRLLNITGDDFKRVTVSVSMPQDRAFLTYVDDAPDRISRVRAALEKAHFRHLHWSGLVVDARMPALLNECHARGMTVSMDCQYREDTLATPFVTDILARLDWFMPNEGEALRLTETATLEESATRLLEHTPRLLVKRGGEGASLWAEGTRLDSPALSLTPVDTTGAGDVFNAGFLAAWLRDEPLPTCLRWGNICGGLSTLGMGGAATAPTWKQVQQTIGTA